MPLETNAEGKVEKATYERIVKEQTQLDLTDENLSEIIARLGILIQERAESGKEWKDM